MKTLSTLVSSDRGLMLPAHIIEALLDHVADRGLVYACTLPGMPSRRAVLQLARRDPGFRASLEAAQTDYAQRLLDEAIDCADAAEDKESATCARVKADIRLRVAAMIAPRVYGRESGATDVGGVVVQLVKLAAQGIRDKALLDSSSVTPLMVDADVYGAEANQDSAIPDASVAVGAAYTGADPGVYAECSRVTGGGGSPATPGAPLSPGPPHTPGHRPKTTYTKHAPDRLVVTLDTDEADIFGGDSDSDGASLDLDEPDDFEDMPA